MGLSHGGVATESFEATHRTSPPRDASIMAEEARYCFLGGGGSISFPWRSLEARRREDSEGVGGKVVSVKGMEMGERESQDFPSGREVRERHKNGTCQWR